MKWVFRAVAAFGLLLASPLAAQSEIATGEGEPFVHARTGTVFPASLGELNRVQMTDYGSGQFDVSANYGDLRSDGTLVTVYLYRPAIPDVSLWFVMAGNAMANSPLRPADEGAMQPQIFTPAGGNEGSGLRMAYDVASSQVRATGLALVPRGNWLLKLRITSTQRDGEEILALVDEVLAKFPTAEGQMIEPAAYLVERCASPLQYRDATPADVTTPQAAATALSAMITAMDVSGPEATQILRDLGGPVHWCRDPQDLGRNPVFRPVDHDDAYLVALSDGGASISVGFIDPVLRQISTESQLYAPVIRHEAEGDTLVALFNGPASPRQVAEALQQERFLASTDRVGGINLDPSLAAE